MVSEHASPLAVLGGVDAGGQNVHVAGLAEALGRRGVDVVVHTRRDDSRSPRRVQLSPHVVVDHIPAGPPEPVSKDNLLPHMPLFARELRRVWDHERPDVVHSHFWMSGWAALAAARHLGIPVTHTFHALGIVKQRHQGARDTSPPARQAIERAIVRDVDRIIATCSDEVFELLRLGGDSRRIGVVPCGVDPTAFHPGVPPEPSPPDRHRVVFVGRLVERKGVGNVIEALGLLRAAGGPDTELVIAGGPSASALDEDSEVQRLRALAHRCGVADRVQLRGRVARADLPCLLTSADIAVCAPWYEPFGIVPLEAMACGTAVLGSAVGGLCDTVVHGETGLLVPPRSPVALAAGLRELLEQPGRLQSMGVAGAERVHRRYSWARVAQQTLASYAAVTPLQLRPSEVWS
jgi:D-inositol-3-phosphate glycosyltransferase